MDDDCDACALGGVPCPGISVHCARGEHCISTVASCAMEPGHPRRCEDCGTRLDLKKKESA